MHIGLIMDGNRRWATGKGMLKMLGHTKGTDNVENVLELCLEKGIEIVSLWVIAKKNIEERSKEEMEHLFGLIRTRIPELVPKMIRKNMRFDTVGDKNLLPEDVNKILDDTKEITKDNTGMVFILAIGYGGQDEIIRGMKSYIRENIDELRDGDLEEVLSKLDEKSFFRYLDTGKYPAPDLIVRTGGDIRHSGYFLYASEYSEYHFTPVYWPDFGKEDLKKALSSFSGAKRNFGK